MKRYVFPDEADKTTFITEQNALKSGQSNEARKSLLDVTAVHVGWTSKNATSNVLVVVVCAPKNCTMSDAVVQDSCVPKNCTIGDVVVHDLGVVWLEMSDDV